MIEELSINGAKIAGMVNIDHRLSEFTSVKLETSDPQIMAVFQDTQASIDVPGIPSISGVYAILSWTVISQTVHVSFERRVIAGKE